MSAPRKYPDEVRARAVRLVRDLVDEDGEGLSVNAASRRVGEQLGINTDTLRNWVKQARVEEGEAPGVNTSEKTRIAQLEREVRELRRANAILKTASAFFAAELDRPQPH
jgi:transposase